jgi:transcriptional regulator NrdR family protein
MMENGVACPNCGCQSSRLKEGHRPLGGSQWAPGTVERVRVCYGCQRAYRTLERAMSGQEAVQREDERAASRAANSAGRRR